MKQMLYKLFNWGIQANQTRTEIERQRNINLICWSTILCCSAILLINIIKLDIVRIISLGSVITSFFIPIILNSFKKTESARTSLIVIGYSIIFTYGILYGEAIGIEYFFLVTPTGIVLLTNDKKLIYLLLTTSAISFIILKVIFSYYPPFLDIPPQLYISTMTGVTILILAFLSANRFKILMILAHEKKEDALHQLTTINAELLQKEEELKRINRELQQEAEMRHGAMQALTASEERYQMLFEHGFEGIMIGNLKTRKPESCNEKLLEFLTMSKEEFLNKNMLEMIAFPEDKNKEQAVYHVLERAKQFEKTGKIQFKIALKSRRKENVIAEVTAVLLPKPNEHLCIAIFKDITQQRKAQEKILSANEGLKNFAHAASHDLKEPLRMIQSFGQLLQRRNKSNLDNSSQEFLGYIIDASSRMNQLIQDLLEYSTTGTNETPPKIIDLNNILYLVKNNLRLKIAESNAIITSEILPKIQAHSTMFSQLFQNIIANAIKFQAPNNQPEISITVKNNIDNIEIRLTDNGIGIAPEYHEQIFGVFKRLHSKTDYAGSGIGLATCRKIVEGYGGKIGVESALNEGTSFLIRLPKNIVVSYETTNESEKSEKSDLVIIN